MSSSRHAYCEQAKILYASHLRCVDPYRFKPQRLSFRSVTCGEARHLRTLEFGDRHFSEPGSCGAGLRVLFIALSIELYLLRAINGGLYGLKARLN